MTSAESFFRHYSLSNKARFSEESCSDNEFLSDFLVFVPEVLADLQDNIDHRQIAEFYKNLIHLKFMVEYADDLNRYWYLLRAYSGGLKRLMDKQTVQHAMEVYLYYHHRYGARRIFKQENWFENKRWQFLDRLIDVEDSKGLAIFFEQVTDELSENFQIYKNSLLRFHREVKKIVDAN
ncbi:hypothetical protein [Gaoshiqia sediminis]|uniref:Uncharacterized protein n=1 Tax=Gaoshiqia sediminis TaxID=2986998 RepID=A0AA41Y7T6_9BACT|nr:hypothetical protein [Gaoshiqia sediminis]MCW0483564.1 hypothetical protein [Gaoshiqia sediminis]